MKNKKLISLKEHNARIKTTTINSPELNGIACPECGEELYDTDPMSVLTSNPPQKKIHCNNCNYSGYRIA